MITSPEIKHTEQDTPEWIPAVGLEQITRAYARIIDEVNALERTELQPAKDVAHAGGWKDPETMERAYQGVDARTVLRVVEGEAS